MRKRRENLYDYIIAGMFLKFDKIDVIDEYLVISDLLPKLGEDNYVSCYGMENIWRFLKWDNNYFTFRDKFNLDSVIDYDYIKDSDYYWYTIKNYYHEGITLKELFSDFAGPIIKEYMDNLDLDEFYKRKKEVLEQGKEELLKNANVLLLSKYEDEYEKLKEFGFSHIDCFKSNIRAFKYFKAHPEILDKYHIVLNGSTPLSYYGKTDWHEKVLRENRNVTLTDYYNYETTNSYKVEFHSSLSGRPFTIKTNNFNDILENTIYSAIINDTINKVDKKYINSKEIGNIDNPKKLELPTKKEDLRILYLNMFNVPEYASEVAKELGLNITFKEDDNYGIENHIATNLGKYDIIIVSNLYSSSILRQKDECVEQCKDTGRRLVLLLNYDDKSTHWRDENGNWGFDKYGKELKLEYTTAGELGRNGNIVEKEYHVLGDDDKYMNRKLMKATIEDAVRIYNDRLIEINDKGLNDISFKTSEQYEEEYMNVINKEEERIKQVLKPIQDFNSLRYTINEILMYMDTDWMTEDEKEVLKDFNIINRDDGLITVEVKENNEVVSRITYLKEYKRDTYREFIFSYKDSAHTIEDKERIGLYTSKHENDMWLPRRANDAELKQLEKMEKTIEEKLAPIAYNAWHREFSYNSKRDSEDMHAEANIFHFDLDLRDPINKYLKYKKEYLVPDKIEGLSISKNGSDISVSIEANGRTLAGITFKERYGGDNLRDFNVSYLNNKGKLQNSGRIGYCTHKLDDIRASLKEPDEKCEEVIAKIKERIGKKIKPLNGVAYRYSHGISEEKPEYAPVLTKRRNN